MAFPAPYINQALGTWDCTWLREQDVAMLRFAGYVNADMLDAAMNALAALLDTVTGEMRVYILADQSGVESYDPDAMVTAALHPAYYHDKGSKLYVVGAKGELYALNDAFRAMRTEDIRLFETLEEALADIDQRRAAYYAKHRATKLD